jgi:hypothetical protein
MSEFDAYCYEHDLKLYPDGSCPLCRDTVTGETFPLDMQSYYLLKKGTPAPRPCLNGHGFNE